MVDPHSQKVVASSQASGKTEHQDMFWGLGSIVVSAPELSGSWVPTASCFGS
jgi:hypothetical protein